MKTCMDCKDDEGNNYKYNPLEVHYTKRDKCPKCNSTNIEKTRSSLVVEWLRILNEKKPNVAIYENVKNLVGKKHKYFFDLFIAELHEYGYNTYWKVLNAKDYGIPQNRERVYLIIIKKELDNGKFEFPKGFDNGIRLKDILEKEVDEKYYISQDKTDKLISQLNDKNSLMLDMCQAKREGKPREYSDFSPTLSARDYKEPRLINSGVIQIGNIVNTGNWDNPQRGRIYSPAPELVGGVGEINFGKQYRQGNRVYSSDKTAMCLLSQPVGNAGGNSYLYLVKEGEELKDSFIEKKYKEFIDKYGYIPEMFNPYNCTEVTDISPTTTTQCGSTTSSATVLIKDIYYRIRKLIPLECFRLMGFNDEDFYILKENKISDTQCYKMAGNSIVVDVLYYIYLELYKAMPYLFEDIKLGSFFSGMGAFEKALTKL